MKRFVVLFYGVICYVAFLGTLLYLIGFVNSVVVPRGLDTGQSAPLLAGTLVNLALVLVFAVQHTVMARPRFKAWWKRTLPEPIGRSTYVLLASLAFALMFWQWRATPETIWRVDEPALIHAIYALQAAGWGLALLSSFLINHFELFGLQQVYLHWRNRRPVPPRFRLPWLYQLVRHPLMLGFLVAFWSTPHMTQGHLVFTVAMTAYIFMGIHFEERDLVRTFGARYETYQRRTNMLVPVPRRND